MKSNTPSHEHRGHSLAREAAAVEPQTVRLTTAVDRSFQNPNLYRVSERKDHEGNDVRQQAGPDRPKSKKPASPKRLLLWTLLVGLIIGLLDVTLPIDSVTQMTWAGFNQHRASDNIVIVKIDDASLRKVGNWPWSRAAHAKLVDQLTRMGARSINFDIMFAYRGDPAGDAAFEKSLEKSGRVTLPIGLARDRTALLKPLTEFSRHTKLADLMIDYDFQNRVRGLSYGVGLNGSRIPSLATSAAGWKVWPDSTFPIDYSVDPKSFLSVSAADVIDGKVSPHLISGRIAFIGTTTDTLGDEYFLPGYGRMGGVYIHAMGAETLIRDRPIDLGWLPALMLSALIGAIAVVTRRALFQTLLLAGGAMLMLVVLGPLQAHLIFLKVGPGIAVLAILTIQLNWARLRNRSEVNDVSGLPNLMALRADPLSRERPLVVARLHNYAEIASALPQDTERLLIDQITARLCVGATGRRLYHGDEGLFAWFAEPGLALGHHLEALHALFRSPVRVRGQHYDVMISFGVDIGSGRAASNRLGSALVAADEAEAEGLKWKYHDPARLADASWKLSLLSQLDEAIEKGEVWVAYQPKLDLATNEIVGVEALARWTHPEKGPISPIEFIGAAEQHDRIEKLTDHILDQAVSAVALAHRQGRPLSLAVNLSARLLNDPDLPSRVADCLARHGLPPSQLILELTETAALAGTGQDIEMLNCLCDLGVKISIDDYGTGLSTLDYLKKVPAAEIKIDQSFIKALRDNRSDRVMVQSTIALAHSLGRIVVAEGVEDRETLELLTTMGCDLAQGFIIGRATSLRNVLKRLKVERGLRVA
jgi:EAL domain-containing protein (putative c-di-GMP-specific phosphodiesterase class I)/CHASE2 domain-containing sensor protein